MLKRYAKMFAIRPGDQMVTYGGFSCIPPDAIVTIEIDSEGMFFRCFDGHHYLKSQQNGNGECLGLSVTETL